MQKDSTTPTNGQKSNLKLLLWFIIALLIALLPWLVLM
jgi:hypothetical protein